MEDRKRIIQVFKDQIALCGPERMWVTMTADDSKKILAWLEAYDKLVERHKALVDMSDELYTELRSRPEIVECQHCKHWVGGGIDDKDNFIPPKCLLIEKPRTHDDFCSYAERK